MHNTKKQIWDFVHELNQCWTQNDPEKLEQLEKFFHPDMIAVTSNDKLRKTNAKECLNGWQWFARNTHILKWQESEPLIRIYADTAIVSYCYEIEFTVNDQKMHSKGWDSLTLVKHDSRWQVVCDHFSSFTN